MGYAFSIDHSNHHQCHCYRHDDKRHHGRHPRSLFICKTTRPRTEVISLFLILIARCLLSCSGARCLPPLTHRISKLLTLLFLDWCSATANETQTHFLWGCFTLALVDRDGVNKILQTPLNLMQSSSVSLLYARRAGNQQHTVHTAALHYFMPRLTVQQPQIHVTC